MSNISNLLKLSEKPFVIQTTCILSLQNNNSSSICRAILGPTNTGKTYYALERMVSYKNGVIGVPLRLLAREIYDRLVMLKGAENVVLNTGEEKIRGNTEIDII